MAVIRRRTVIAANSSVDVNLSPFDRFAGRGGRVKVKATALLGQEDDITMDVLVGSDVLASGFAVPAERTVGLGPDAETPDVSGVGAPADPITVTLINANVAARTVDSETTVDNL